MGIKDHTLLLLFYQCIAVGIQKMRGTAASYRMEPRRQKARTEPSMRDVTGDQLYVTKCDTLSLPK